MQLSQVSPIAIARAYELYNIYMSFQQQDTAFSIL